MIASSRQLARNIAIHQRLALVILYRRLGFDFVNYNNWAMIAAVMALAIDIVVTEQLFEKMPIDIHKGIIWLIHNNRAEADRGGQTIFAMETTF